MYNAGNNSRTEVFSLSWVKLGGDPYLHSGITNSGLSGGGAELSSWICLVKAWAASFSR